jgi:polysaccharide biosynthesis transport protein
VIPDTMAPESNEPRAQGARSRFVIAHARWIVLVTAAVVVATSALVLLQTPQYVSAADVLVQAGPNATLQPDMGTEAGVAASGAVLATASRSLHVPKAELANGLSVHEPGTTFTLQVSYSDASPQVAQQRAQAIAAAYVAYRSSLRARHATAQGAAPIATLITPALLPAAPSSPDTALDIGAALIVGLALAFGSAWLRDRLDDRVRGPADLEVQSGGAPVLAQIPAFQSSSRYTGSWLAMTASPDSAVAQAYRDLRARLIHSAHPNAMNSAHPNAMNSAHRKAMNSAHPNAMSLLVTSPAGEDRAEVAANLSIAFAQAGHSTVLVCADLRDGRSDEMFGLAGGDGLAGLTGILSGRSTMASALRSSGVPGLRVLPRGEAPLDTAALLQNPICRDLFGYLSRQADVTVVEAPPLLAAADASLLADLADRILLVADERRSARSQVRGGMRDIEHVRSKVAGWALCNVGRVYRLRALVPLPADSGPTDLGDHVREGWPAAADAVVDAWPASDTIAKRNGNVAKRNGN